MAKPRLIILIRHAQSEGNKNREIHQSTPDHRVKLTQQGWGEAHEAGRRLRNLLRPDDTLHFFTSPYRRTRETTEGILETLTSDEPGPSPFPRSNIKVYEEPRLREQDFGNFQPCSDEMERMWQERADYGHFFYRIPNGESAADAYDRVSGFNESLWRQFGEDDFASVCVLVTHGLMSRIFLMKWYHFSVEYFEDLRNVNHCEFLIMRKQDNGKYHLENNLRTWSQLRRERALKEAKEGKDGKDGKESKEAAAVAVAAPAPATSKIVDRSKSFVATRRWGGCPNGCNHSRHYKKREDLEVLRQKDTEGATTGVIVSPVVPPITTTSSTTTTVPAGVAIATANNSGGGLTIASRRQRIQRATSSEDEGNGNTHKTGTKVIPAHIDLTRTMSRGADEPLSSPEIVLRHPHHLHIGRDFGGTYSGHTSTAGSDTDASDDDHHHRHHRRLASTEDRVGPTGLRSHTPAEDDDDDGDDDSSGHHHHNHNHSHRNCANRLGDVPADGDGDGDGDGDEDGDGDGNGQEDLDKAEKEDRSVKGSVY